MTDGDPRGTIHLRISRKTIVNIAVAIVVAAVVAGGYAWLYHLRHTSAMNACVNNLRQIDAAKQQWALNLNKRPEDVPSWDDIRPYIGRPPSALICPGGGTYLLGSMNAPPHCSIMEDNFDFGHVHVVDQYGSPLNGVRVALRGPGGEVCNAQTSGNGEANLLSDTDIYLSAHATNHPWSDSTKRIIASLDGYSDEQVSLPTIFWPVRIKMSPTLPTPASTTNTPLKKP